MGDNNDYKQYLNRLLAELRSLKRVKNVEMYSLKEILFFKFAWTLLGKNLISIIYFQLYDKS